MVHEMNRTNANPNTKPLDPVNQWVGLARLSRQQQCVSHIERCGKLYWAELLAHYGAVLCPVTCVIWACIRSVPAFTPCPKASDAR